MAALGMGWAGGGFVEPTAAPGSFLVTYQYDGSQLELAWEAVAGACGYTVYLGASPGSLQPVSESTGVGYTATGLGLETVFFQVLARFSSRASIAAQYADGGGGGGASGGLGRAGAPAQGVYLLVNPVHFLLIDAPGNRLRIS